MKYIFFWFYRSVRFEAKERVTTCKDYIIGREITTVLKIAVDSVTLELCDSRNNFTKKKERKPIKFNRDFEERKLLFVALVSNCLHRSCPNFQIKTITSSKISQQLRLMVQSATRDKQIVCSRCQLLCYR